MNLSSYVGMIRQRRALFLRIFAAAAVVLAIAAVFVEAGFVATSSVLLVAEAPSTSAVGADSATKPILSADLPFLATTPAVLAAVARDLGLPTTMRSLDKLRHRIKPALSSPPAPISQAPGALLVISF